MKIVRNWLFRLKKISQFLSKTWYNKLVRIKVTYARKKWNNSLDRK